MTSDNLRQELPKWAKMPINRCNVPVEVLGNLGFQDNPQPILLDGVAVRHADLFAKLAQLNDKTARADAFVDYMTGQFLLNEATSKKKKTTYLRLLRGWFFDPDGREAAVIKGWVESRFGLSPCYHGGRLMDKTTETYQRYIQMRSDGLYNTNAIEAQLDLLYSFCQFELNHLHQEDHWLTLYRGVNRLDEFTVQIQKDRKHASILLNNVNSFSADRDTAGSFGDIIMSARIPKEKIFCFPGMLSQKFQSEHEYMVIGGLYLVDLSY